MIELCVLHTLALSQTAYLLKCNENPSRVGGDMEHTRNNGLDSIICNCNRDFESA